MIPLAKEFLSDIGITPHWVALTISQIPRWCGISALQFTFDVTHSFAATLSYWTIFTIFCLLFSSVWFPHKSKLREFSTSALQVHRKGWSKRGGGEGWIRRRGFPRWAAATDRHLAILWQTFWKRWDRSTHQSLSTFRADKNAHPVQTGCFLETLKGERPGEYPLAECSAVLVKKEENNCKT